MSHDGISVRIHFEVDGIRGSERMRIYGAGEAHPTGEALWWWSYKLGELKATGEIADFKVLSAEFADHA
jgi:hypothetical protein